MYKVKFQRAKKILKPLAVLSAVMFGFGNDAAYCAEGYEIDYSAEVILSASEGTLAPYYMASNRHGILTQGNNALVRAGISRDMNLESRFSYGFGADFVGGYSNSTDYLRWNDDAFQPHAEHPARVWIQQLYGEVKYRGVFLLAGLKEHESALVDFNLSSGDIVESGNARPIPEIRAGFIDYQNIPFTNGWVQIFGEIGYGKLTDNAWLRNHYNYYMQHLNQGAFYTYKRCYFRANPDKPFSAIIGMQSAGMFGGSTQWYYYGKYQYDRKFSSSFKQFFKMFIPSNEGQEYVSGSSLGSWDISMRYRLRNGMTIRGYMQKPWEDGSGIGFLNGFDGVWGLEFKTNRGGIVSGAVVEYIDFTNQSGPMHWDPEDHPGTDLWHRAEGADDYYNNHEYNPYAYYGMSIGTPFLQSPIYNRDGAMMFVHNRVRGFHVGVEGEIGSNLSYRVLGGYRKSFGSGYVPLIDTVGDTSVMIEGRYRVPKVEGLDVKAQLALDRGELYGNNFGACVSVSYSGALAF